MSLNFFFKYIALKNVFYCYSHFCGKYRSAQNYQNIFEAIIIVFQSRQTYPTSLQQETHLDTHPKECSNRL